MIRNVLFSELTYMALILECCQASPLRFFVSVNIIAKSNQVYFATPNTYQVNRLVSSTMKCSKGKQIIPNSVYRWVLLKYGN